MTQAASQRILLPVRRFDQIGDECGIAAVSAIANYYEPNIVYKNVRKLVSKRLKTRGLYSSQLGLLLNKLGFKKVTIISYDMDIFDYTWNELSKEDLIKRLTKSRRYFYDSLNNDYAQLAASYIKWLSDSTCDNTIRVDNDLSTHIKRQLRFNRPVIAVIDWTSLYKEAKENGDIRGYASSHAVVIRGCDDDNVFIADSSSMKKSNGYYKMKWSKLLSTMVYGDIVTVG